MDSKAGAVPSVLDLGQPTGLMPTPPGVGQSGAAGTGLGSFLRDEGSKPSGLLGALARLDYPKKEPGT